MANRQSDAGPVYWRQGEHVAIVGDTGQGKTYLMARLVQFRSHTVVIRTKPDDIRFSGFTKRRRADALNHVYAERILLTPEYHRQAYEAWHALENIYQHGGWCCAIDELWYLDKQLGLGGMVDRLLTQGRSKSITVVAGMQRPSQISRFVLSQITHLFTFQTEGRDTKILGESTTPRIVEPIASLTGHDFVYYNRRTRQVMIGNARRLGAIFSNSKRVSLSEATEAVAG